MATANTPLDEIVDRREDVIRWWVEDDSNGVPPPRYPMEERMIHRYFSQTKFFDQSTTNGLLFRQSEVNPDTYALVHDRKALENRLRERPGIEYIIAGSPQQVAGAPPGENSGVWVIRKQERLGERLEGVEAGTVYPKTETRGTYYIINENVYQAPSVADVVGNRLLSAITSFEKAFEKSRSLASFSPASGYSYLPSKPTKTATASNQASPSRSREGSVAPGTVVDVQSLRSGSVIPEGHTTASNADSDIANARLLAQSLQMSIQFDDEYIDENPIIGEPGNFKFTSSLAAVKKRKADEEAALAAARKAREPKQTTSAAPSPAPAKAQTPPPVFSEAKTAAAAKVEKEKRREEKKRKKSRANVSSSGTPSRAASLVPTAPSSNG